MTLPGRVPTATSIRSYSLERQVDSVSHVWQDVYHCVTPNGKVAYVKVTLRVDGSIVLQFKEK